MFCKDTCRSGRLGGTTEQIGSGKQGESKLCQRDTWLLGGTEKLVHSSFSLDGVIYIMAAFGFVFWGGFVFISKKSTKNETVESRPSLKNEKQSTYASATLCQSWMRKNIPVSVHTVQ
jgi:hypothetical protein